MRGGFSIAVCSTSFKKVKSEHSTFSHSAGLCSNSWFMREAVRGALCQPQCCQCVLPAVR